MRAAEMAQALGGKAYGSGGYLTCCVAHDDRTPSLAIRDGEGGALLVCCHAGCDQAAVIAALRERGLWGDGERQAWDPRLADAARAARRDQDRERTAFAFGIWESTRCGVGSLAETYLRRARFIALAMPDRLRFAILKHPSGQRLPAMVGLVTDSADRPLAIHRTFLARDGCGKAPVKPARMSLGPVRGGAVRLAPVAERLIVGEGLETTLSAMQLSGLPGWSALSAGGLDQLELPGAVASVVIAADRDTPGMDAARNAATRWIREGREVAIRVPPAPHKDFADMLAAQRNAPQEFAS